VKADREDAAKERARLLHIIQQQEDENMKLRETIKHLNSQLSAT